MSTIDADMVAAHFIVSDDVERSRRFYTDVLGGRTVIQGEAGDEVTYVALANTWVIIKVGGGPTDDKPTVTLETPRDPNRVSSFLNLRVKDIQAVYSEWSARGAEFLTPPKSTTPRSTVTSATPTATSSRWVRRRSPEAGVHRREPRAGASAEPTPRAPVRMMSRIRNEPSVGRGQRDALVHFVPFGSARTRPRASLSPIKESLCGCATACLVWCW